MPTEVTACGIQTQQKQGQSPVAGFLPLQIPYFHIKSHWEILVVRTSTNELAGGDPIQPITDGLTSDNDD